MQKTKTYVGEVIRKHIKDNCLTNAYVIKGLSQKGFKVSPSKFSNKIYGVNDKFTQEEVDAISVILNKNF